MNKQINKKIIISSTVAIALLGSAFSYHNVNNNTIDNSQIISYEAGDITPAGEEKKIAAFSNLDSFDNDGFNKSVKNAALNYNKGIGKTNEVTFKTSMYSDTGQEYVKMLQNLFVENDIIISAGFQVANAITGLPGDDGFDGVFKNNDDYLNNGKSFVLLDDSSLATQYENAASVNFQAEGAGYMSGIGAAVYAEYDAISNEKNNANIVMWGGMPFPTVYSYMSGFAQGIAKVNEKYNGQELTLSDGSTKEFMPINLWSGGETQGENVNDTNAFGGENNKWDSWYTMGFDASTGTSDGDKAKIKTDNAYNAGASLVFPIAGGNTAVAEQELVGAPKSSTTKLMGVDVDSTQSSSHPDLYVGSATKNLVDGGEAALWGIDSTITPGASNTGVRNWTVEDLPEDATEADKNYKILLDSWKDPAATAGPGLALMGTIENDGVGFTYEGQKGNADQNMKNATGLFSIADLDTFIDGLVSGTTLVNDYNNFFDTTADDAPAGTTSDVKWDGTNFVANDPLETSSLTWLWITLGVLSGIGIIALIVWLVLRAKGNKTNKEESI